MFPIRHKLPARVLLEKSGPLRVRRPIWSLIETAARLFRDRGIDGVGVAEIGKQAGLTHGALYAQFATKEELAAEAMAFALDRGYARLTAPKEGRPADLSDYFDDYLSPVHRDNVAKGCAMAASASEVARWDEALSARFAEGFEQLAGAIEAALGETTLEANGRARALAIMAAMIGAVAVARVTKKARPALSNDVLRAVRAVLGEVGGEPRRIKASGGGPRRGRGRGASL